jgi:hypothetical protein
VSAIAVPLSLLTSGTRSDAATYSVTPADTGSAHPTSCGTPIMMTPPATLAAPTRHDAPSACARVPCAASTMDAIANPSGALWSAIAVNRSTPRARSTRKLEPIVTPSKNEWTASPISADTVTVASW